MNQELWQDAFATLKANKRITILIPENSNGNELGGAVALRSHIIEQSKNVQDVFIIGGPKTNKFDFIYKLDHLSDDQFKNSQKVVLGTTDITKLSRQDFDEDKTIFFANEENDKALISVHQSTVPMGELIWEFSATAKDAQLAHSYKDATFISIFEATNNFKINWTSRTRDIFSKCSMNAHWLLENLLKKN